MVHSVKDNELFCRVKEGDREAFNQLFLKFYSPLLRFAKSIVEEADAKDLIADLFLDLWMKRNELTINTSVRVYLHIAVKNRALNSKRRKTKNICTSEEELDLIEDNRFDRPDNLLIAKEFDKKINYYIGQLPERCRMIFLLNRDNRLSYEEIAQLLDISLNTVKTQMFRALRFLRASVFLTETSRQSANDR